VKKYFRIFKSYSTPEQKKEKRKQLLFGLSGGLMLGLSFPPLPVPYLLFFSLIPYLYILQKREGLAEINRFTYFFFFFFNITTLYWVGSWTKDADPFLMIAGSTLMFFNPLLFLIPSTLYYYTKRSFGKNIALYLFPFFWVFYEYIYTVSDFRFPWLTLANGLAKFNIFIQTADIIGAYGISLIIIYINIFLLLLIKEYLSSKKISKLNLVPLLVLLILPVVYGFVKISTYQESDKRIKMGLIQPNLNPWKKWEAGGIKEQLDVYLQLSEQAVKSGAKVIIWPESAMPVYLLTGSYELELNRIHQFLDRNNVHLMTGMPDATFFYDSTTAPEDAKKTSGGTFYTSYNSILFFTPHSKTVQKYGKIMLVPFGEKVPLVEDIPFLGDIFRWNVGISSWNTGKEIKVFNMENATNTLGGVICIESIYPDFCSKFVDKGAEMIAIVTNDSWYGNSSGPYQHKEFAALRAIENNRAVVRAANGGISCLIDPLGRTVAKTEMFTRNFLVVDVPLNKQKTFYTKYPLLVPYLSLIVTLTAILLSIFINFKKRFNNK